MIFTGCHLQERPVIDRWQTSNSAVEIRITESEEKHFPLSKFCYVFEANRPKSAEWHKIMTECTDDDIPIPRDQVRFLSDQTAYIFMVYKYAITTNGGDSWFVWEANEAITNSKYPGQWFIKEVHVSSDGTGTLLLASRSEDNRTIQLLTNDFGHSWKSK
jgi:hypothetical protein